MKYYIIAGESSGDLHGANLMKHLKRFDAEAKFRFWGGDMMLKQDDSIVKHYKDLAFMGFTEVLTHLYTIFNNLRLCKKDIINFKPDVLILIDYPGFNLRISKFAKKSNIKIFYYISPQIWAWKKSRIKTIKKNVDKMFVILPFEKDFYKSCGMDVDFVGHPLLDVIEDYQKNNAGDNISNKNIVAILPGSRKQEIKKMLPVMLDAAANFPDMQFVVAGTSSVDKHVYDIISNYKNVVIKYDCTCDILAESIAAMVTSGTATLEAALFGVPEVVCYKGSILSYYIAKYFIKVKYISLVNLIIDKSAVEELIQHDFNSSKLTNSLSAILFDTEIKEKIQKNYHSLREKLGNTGASEKTAKLMIERLKKQTL